MDAEMKTMREDFVSGLKGTSVGECVCVLVACLLLDSVVNVWSVVIYQLGMGDQGIVRRMALMIFGLVLTLTVASNWILTVCVSVVALLVVGSVNSLILSKGTKLILEIRTTVHRHQGGDKYGFLYLSKVRGCILLTASITILAVDFSIFPRRWAKTEIYGTGLMDLGVGTFAILTGLVWPRHLSGDKIIRKIAALVILGFIRLVTVKYVGYNEHESEYGRHWNFFFTLAFVVLIGTCLSRVSSSLKGNTITLLVLAFIQHMFLVRWKYEEVCVDNKVERGSSLFIGNKEGLISLVGYTLLWLVGRLLSHVMKKKSSVWCTCLLFWSVFTYVLIDYEYLQVSRRTSNLAYVLWTSGCMTFCLVLSFLMDMLVNVLQDRANYVTKLDCPDVFSIVNRRSLFYFLFSNVLTGAINLTVNPLMLNPHHSILILLIYTSLPIITILCLDIFVSTGASKKA